MIKAWYLVFCFLLINLIQCKRCDLSDEVCLTEGGNQTHHIFVNGIDGKVPPSDPIFVDLIEINLPAISYTLKNGTFSGMKNCDVTKLNLKVNDLTFAYHFICPLIVTHADYEIKGKLDAFDIEGKGEVTVTYEDYAIMFHGSYQNTTEYLGISKFDVETDAKGHVTFDFKNLFDGNDVKSKKVHKYIHDNLKTVEKQLSFPVLQSSMKKFIENLNKFMNSVPRDAL